MPWLTEQIEFADGGPVFPAGSHVELYDSRDTRHSRDDVHAVRDCVRRLVASGAGEQVIIAHGRWLSAIPRRVITGERPQL